MFSIHLLFTVKENAAHFVQTKTLFLLILISELKKN